MLACVACTRAFTPLRDEPRATQALGLYSRLLLLFLVHFLLMHGAQSLKYTDPELVSQTLTIVHILIADATDHLIDHMDTLIPLLIQLTQHQVCLPFPGKDQLLQSLGADLAVPGFKLKHFTCILDESETYLMVPLCCSFACARAPSETPGSMCQS